MKIKDTWIFDLKIEPNFRQVVSNRIEGLLHPNIVKHHAISKLLESAYIQGLVDSAEIYKLKDN